MIESRDGTRIREAEDRAAPSVRRAARRAASRRRERAAEASAAQCDLFPDLTTDDPIAPEAATAITRPVLRLVELPASRPVSIEEPEPEVAEPEVTIATEPTERLTADQWFELAVDLESESPLEARAAYHKALELNAMLVDAQVNLGRLYHEAGELGKAEAHYREATLLAPRDPTSHFNLGVLLEDLGRHGDAVYAYRQALAREADYADAHYNLALVLERLGRKSDAISHLAKANALYGPSGRRP